MTLGSTESMPTNMMNLYENLCQRCGKTVYQVDRIGPLKDFSFFHSCCFKCLDCGSKLTLKTYCNNQADQDDKEVYCSSHVPKIGPGHMDGDAVGIRSALNVPKSSHFVNEQIRPGGKPSLDNESLALKSPLRNQQSNSSCSENGHNSSFSDHKYGRFDHTALHIAHALNATKIQKSYLRFYDKPIDTYLDVGVQKQMEMKHRMEEDDLYSKFAKQRQAEQCKIEIILKEEWEAELEKLTSRFERDIAIKRRNKDEAKVMTVRHQKERDELEKNMTIKRDQKKESLTRKLLEHERAATAALVEKHSKEMMCLIQDKRSEHIDEEQMQYPPTFGPNP